MQEQEHLDLSADNSNERNVTQFVDPGDLGAVDRPKFNPKWQVEPTIMDLKQDLEFARQENTDQKTNVTGWIALRNATGAESGIKSTNAGRSQVQPKLIRKHNEWRYPALSEPFLNTDRMYEIKPRTANDKKASKQNQLLLNWQFDTKLNKVSFIDRYVRKTVDEGTCILRVGWKRTTEKVLVERTVFKYFSIPEDDEEMLGALAEATQLYLDKHPEYNQLPETLQASVEYSAENQIAVYAEENGTEKVYENKITFNAPELTIVNTANFFIDPTCDGVWEDAQFIIHTYEASKSDLKKRGIFENLDKVNWGATRVVAAVGDQDHESNSPDVSTRVNTDKDKSIVYEYWGEFDVHKNGTMTPIVVTWIGDQIIQMAENPFPDRKPPFVVVPYMPILGSVFGEADASLLQDNQRILGAVNRGIIDLLGRSANAQIGYAKGFLDSTNKKRMTMGLDFEFNPGQGDMKSAMEMLKFPEIPNSALQVSSLQNAEAEGLSGVKSFSAGITGDAYGKVARGISGAMDAAGQREMSILRRLAEGIKIVGAKIISMNAQFLEEEEIVRVTDEEFVPVRKDELEGKFDLIVGISTQSVDEAKAQDLGFMLQTQGPNMDPGLEQIILAEIAELKRMPHLAKRILEYKPEPDPLMVEMRQLEIVKLKAEIELMGSKSTESDARAENIALDTELDAQGIKHERNIEASGAQARGNRDLKVTEQLLKGDSSVGNIQAAVGFNKLTEEADQRETQLPLAPLQSAQQLQLPLQQQEPLAFQQ